jgi:hypothetical protein
MFSWKPAPSVGVAATAAFNGRSVIASLTGQGRRLRAAFSACLSCTRHKFLPVRRKGLSCVQSMSAFVKLRVKWSPAKWSFVTFHLLRVIRCNLIRSVHPRLWDPKNLTNLTVIRTNFVTFYEVLVSPSWPHYQSASFTPLADYYILKIQNSCIKCNYSTTSVPTLW